MIATHNKGATEGEIAALEKDVAKMVIEAKDAGKKGLDPLKTQDFKDAASSL